MSDSMRSRGMRDVLPAEMGRFRRIERVFREVCLGWGYGEVRTPTIEHLYLFTAAGTLSPQMLDRVYSFLDWDGWSGERVVLRPDSTIAVARLYVEQLGDQRLAKLFYVQNVLRFVEGDESREGWQCGVELIGDTQPQGDLELILVACEVLQRLGLSPDLKLSDPAILRTVLSKAGFTQTEQLALYDRILEGDLTALDEMHSHLPQSDAPVGAILTVDGAGAKYLNNLRGGLLPTIPEAASALDELAAVSDVLLNIGLPHLISPILVRNFEYYTGPVFQLYVDEKKVGSGGRYDALISLVGGANVPAAGFALDFDALSALLAEAEWAVHTTVTIRCTDANGENLPAVFALARALRAADIAVTVSASEVPSSPEILASRNGFVLNSDGAQAWQLADVDGVVRAVAELVRD